SLDNGLPAYVTLQPEYNLYDRQGFESGLQQLCVENNIGVISYYSLASGFLTGKYRSKEDGAKSVRGGGIVDKYINERGLRILDALDEIAKNHKTVPAVVALAWLIHKPAVAAPIASATSVTQLSELVKAVELTLAPEEMQVLDQA